MRNDNEKLRHSRSRACAVRALEWVFGRHKALDVFFEQDQRFASLDSRDKALCRAILGNSIRRLGQIDQVLGQLIAKPLPKQAVTPRLILRAGAAELLFLRSAPHGVVHSFVQLADRLRGCKPYKGLINAVLRKIVREGEALLAGTCIDSNIPQWPAQDWDRIYGSGTSRRAALAMQEPPALDLTVLRHVSSWQEQLGAVRIGSQTLRLQHRGRVNDLKGYDTGQWIVQDASAALPVQILDPQPGEAIADLCAAPGGKTMQLASLGAKVTAIDSNEGRLKRLHENLHRTALDANIICADASIWQVEQKFDAVLLDAPCSATGIFRHHPDVLYNRRAKDIAAYGLQQLAIAVHAADLLRPEGRMVYCVCSAQPEEGEQVIERLLAETNMVQQPICPEKHPFIKPFLSAGAVRIAPGTDQVKGSMDSFYIALLHKP